MTFIIAHYSFAFDKKCLDKEWHSGHILSVNFFEKLDPLIYFEQTTLSGSLSNLQAFKSPKAITLRELLLFCGPSNVINLVLISCHIKIYFWFTLDSNASFWRVQMGKRKVEEPRVWVRDVDKFDCGVGVIWTCFASLCANVDTSQAPFYDRSGDTIDLQLL